MKVYYLAYNGYEKNPLVKYSLKKVQDQGVDTEIIQLKDIGDIIEKCNHTKECLRIGDMGSYIGDQIRMYLGMTIPDFFYMDLDSYWNDIKSLPENFVAKDKGTGLLNDGSGFRGCKDWCEYYYNIYQNNWQDLIYPKDHVAKVNYVVRQEHPCDIKVESVEPNGVHFFLSQIERYKKWTEDRRVVYYTFNDNPSIEKESHIYWKLKKSPLMPFRNGALNNHIYFYDLDYFKIDLNLWKQQMCYTMGNPCLIFKEI